MKKLLGFIFMLSLMFLLIACDDGMRTVTFDSNGGTTVTAVEVKEGEFVTAPTAPTKTGYVFAGWFEDKELSTAFSFGKTPVTKDITLYAKWLSDQEVVDLAHSWLTLTDLDNLTNSSPRLILPIKAANYEQVAISWAIDKPQYISSAGVISQPENEVGDQTVTLTATLTLNQAVKTKTFTANVKALPPVSQTTPLLDEDFKGYPDGEVGTSLGNWGLVSGKAGTSVYTVVSSIENVTIPEGSKALKLQAFSERQYEMAIPHTYNVVVIEADLMQTASNGSSLHIQSSSSSPVIGFGLNGDEIYWRVDNGTQYGVKISLNTFYRARFEVDLVNKTVQLFYYQNGQLMPVTEGPQSYTGELGLNSIFLRTGSSTTSSLRDPAYVTNIVVNRIEALPRPAEIVKLGEVTDLPTTQNIAVGSTFTASVPKIFNYYGSKRELVKDTDYTLTVSGEVNTAVAGTYNVTYTFANKNNAEDVKTVTQVVTVYSVEQPNEITAVQTTFVPYPERKTTITVTVVQPEGKLYYLFSNNETENAEAIKAGTEVNITSETVQIENATAGENAYLHVIVVLNGDSNIKSEALDRQLLVEIDTPQKFYDALHASESVQKKSYYLLTADLDFTGFTWTSSVDFYSVLDGNNHTISNLSITVPTGSHAGIADELRGGTFKNLTLSNISINAVYERVGILAGRTTEAACSIENITITNSLVTAGTEATKGDNLYAALLIGRTEVDTTMTNIKVVNSEVIVNGKYSGGLVAQIEKGSLTITDADVEIKVTENSTSPQCVGLVGRAKSDTTLTMTRVIAKVNFNGDNNIGGLVGINQGTVNVTDALVTGSLNAVKADSGALCGKGQITFTNVWAVALTGEGTGSNKQSAPAENTLADLNTVSVASWWTENMPNLASSTLWDIDGFASLKRAEIKKYTITFVVQEHTVDPILVRENSKAVLPTPVKVGFNFDGWYTDSAFENLFDTDTPITADLTLYGRFEEITAPLFDVIFDSNGGSDVESQKVVQNELATEPTDPTKDGFVFGGWFTDDGTFANEFDFTEPITANITLYAKWIDLFEVSFEMNGGEEIPSQLVQDGGLLTSVTPKRSGYVFVNWYTDEGLTTVFSFETPITANLTLYAKWEEIPPIQIGTPEEFIAFLNNPTSDVYVLTADLDLTGLTYTPKPFAGVLDGQGHKISNLTYSGSGYAGMFTVLKGTVRNLQIHNASITSTGDRAGIIAAEVDVVGVVITRVVITNSSVSGAGDNGVGGVVGLVKDGAGGISVSFIKMENVTVTNSKKIAGGVIGHVRGSGATTIYDVQLKGITLSATTCVGGAVGYIRNPLSFTMARAVIEDIDATATGSDGYAAGLVGRADAAPEGSDGWNASDILMKDIFITGQKYIAAVEGRYNYVILNAVYGGGFTFTGSVSGQDIQHRISEWNTLDESWFETNLPALTANGWNIVDHFPVLTAIISE